MWLKSYGDRAPIDEDRLRAMRHALVSRDADAFAYRTRIKVKEPYLAAALSGRGLAYREAVMMLDAILEGRKLHRPMRVRRREKARIAAIRAAKATAKMSFHCRCGYSYEGDGTPDWDHKPFWPDSCCNCGGQKCMDCVGRVYHDKCENSCPDCLAKSAASPSTHFLDAKIAAAGEKLEETG